MEVFFCGGSTTVSGSEAVIVARLAVPCKPHALYRWSSEGLLSGNGARMVESKAACSTPLSGTDTAGQRNWLFCLALSTLLPSPSVWAIQGTTPRTAPPSSSGDLPFTGSETGEVKREASTSEEATRGDFSSGLPSVTIHPRVVRSSMRGAPGIVFSCILAGDVKPKGTFSPFCISVRRTTLKENEK